MPARRTRTGVDGLGTRATPFVVSITTFDQQQRLDEQALREHLRRLRDANVGVYLAGGGSGEGFALELPEIRRIFEIGAEELLGHVPVRAMGFEPHRAKQLHEIIEAAQQVGLDAAQVYSLDGGHVFRPGPAEMRAYYADVLEGIDLPLILSTHPAVGYSLPSSIVEELCAERNVIGLNVTTNDIPYLSEQIAVLRQNDWLEKRISVHVGGEMHGLTNLALGGQGIVSSMGNLVPRLLARMHTSYEAGEYQQAESSFVRLLDIYVAFTKLGGSKALKVALDLLGLAGGPPRRPRLPVPDELVPEIEQLLTRFDIRASEGLA
jgi:4-hydroxy-tetrahydrodipicolinate synthase